ncbi:hypothetical protein HQ40_03690 [Porphyromonas gulae]|uniref:restriction endonuclease PLD domain-containing protein n=1 Tax=Porphyromonas gulae TaxID=111105 RepID=UPI00052BFEC8|nr:restriction endonuclease PLD domain-containing protein [Porphyromonas gulae]KGN76592.1 hypothetical protein HQ40_03690 [Porphyromonas gulae]KGN88584.1 hypothetical protein HQ46_06700 [Porphyromonas gulae]
MDILFSKNPIIRELEYQCVNDKIVNYFENATQLNIATGFISNESIVELRRLIEYRNQTLSLSLFIGMNYIDGFTKLQYNAIKELHSFLNSYNLGNVFVSPRALYHGKMYSFMNASSCLGAFVGSSNLGSFIGTTSNYIEADVFFDRSEGLFVNEKIIKLTQFLGKKISETKEVVNFKEPEKDLLDGFEFVDKLSSRELKQYLQKETGQFVSIPLKTEPKSNLNTYFGAGKMKGRFSRRDYYEVELIISKKTPNLGILPSKEDGPFWVITTDGYKFECSRQGDYGKNFRSQSDLKILGKWIKGQMENAGALNLGEPVTDSVLDKFGKRFLLLKQTQDKHIWILDLK